ncbi:MAG: DJ-1 family glyoxalase III [Kiritimatiellia bacterium]
MARALIPLANGVEEMEAVIAVDVLRRACWEVTTAGITGTVVTASRGVKLVADSLWADVDPANFQVLVLPGGGDGTKALIADGRILETIRTFVASHRIVAAICAAPLVLEAAGVLRGRRTTCHPDVRAEIKTATYCAARVVIDGKIVTSQGPGTAFEFVLALVSLLDGPRAAEKVAAAMVLPPLP